MKKKKTIKKKLQNNPLSSIPTEISLQKKELQPAEINNLKVFEIDQPISFFQEHLQEIRFNPFDEFIPNDSLMAPDFFYPNDDYYHLDHHELNLGK